MALLTAEMSIEKSTPGMKYSCDPCHPYATTPNIKSLSFTVCLFYYMLTLLMASLIRPSIVALTDRMHT